ncbi:SIR2 family protein [Leptospira bandrabouensis]|uniref:SIR2 family protein n=1 Tax=Leptospira bandrabouensis TaxID=2484903 RepID=UPI00223E1CE0|nr:SIR2 family protein [Leptospira bandrabouensis]MCW7479400.1 SIR2 family protein [Leptospira bandrabouensis]MCW7487083.1 SIR2 family protein [Leptospira bandrabouensis]
MENKKTFILGAGSSISASKGKLPSILNFFEKLKELGLSKTNNIERIKIYVESNLGKSIENKQDKIDIEKLLTLLQIDIEKSNRPEFSQIKEDLVELISTVIGKCQNNIDNDEDYPYFTNLLSEKDSIITFNWDTLLDITLKNQKKPQYSRYKEEFTANYEQDPNEEFYFKSPYNLNSNYDLKGNLLKMHGSIDWYCCKNNYCKIANKIFILDTTESTYPYKCGECHEPVYVMIIPPVLNKSYNTFPVIRKIWNLAARDIEITNHLIIWGYSLPPTDFYSEWLIRQIRKGRRLKALTIIDPSVVNTSSETTNVRLSFVRKYYDIFRDLNIEKTEIFLYQYFSDYKEKIDIFQKFNIKKENFLKNL